jgi:hypothetical protein
VDAFDRHRIGDVDNGSCLDPDDAARKSGGPTFVAEVGVFGVTWRRWRADRDPAWYARSERMTAA